MADVEAWEKVLDLALQRVAEAKRKKALKKVGELVVKGNPIQPQRKIRGGQGFSNAEDAMLENVLYFARMFGNKGRDKVRSFMINVRESKEQMGVENGTKSTCQSLREMIDIIDKDERARVENAASILLSCIHSTNLHRVFRKMCLEMGDPKTDIYQELIELGLCSPEDNTSDGDKGEKVTFVGRGRGPVTVIKAYYLHVKKGFSMDEAMKIRKDSSKAVNNARANFQAKLNTARDNHKLE